MMLYISSSAMIFNKMLNMILSYLESFSFHSIFISTKDNVMSSFEMVIYR